MIHILKRYKETVNSYFTNCYNDMRKRRAASDCKCGGLTGGEKMTEYLSEVCLDCPYLELGYSPK